MDSRRLREVALLIIGITTPVGVLVVNGSAFVMRHLVEFRWGIAACALVSSLLLNGLTAWWVLAQVGRSTPDLYIEYRRWAIGVAVVIVLVSSAGAAYFTFGGLGDPKHLPDTVSVITATLMLAIPFTLAYVGRRLAARRQSGPVAGETRPEIRRRQPQE